MISQIGIFDMMTSSLEIPMPNEQGFISAQDLEPVEWERWKYAKSDWTLMGGEPYVIDAVLAILPGNRLYVKEWMLYPFMYEYKSTQEVFKKYRAIRQKIVERMARNNDIQRTWQVDEKPTLQDMWKCGENEYSCEEYARKANHGYQIRAKGE